MKETKEFKDISDIKDNRDLILTKDLKTVKRIPMNNLMDFRKRSEEVPIDLD